jgi:hypothetical protein
MGSSSTRATIMISRDTSTGCYQEADLKGVRREDVARIHYPPCTDSIKSSLQFSCNFVVINASEGSLVSRMF